MKVGSVAMHRNSILSFNRNRRNDFVAWPIDQLYSKEYKLRKNQPLKRVAVTDTIELSKAVEGKPPPPESDITRKIEERRERLRAKLKDRRIT